MANAISGLPDDSAGKYEVVQDFERHKRWLFTGAAFFLLSANIFAQAELAEQSHHAKELMSQGRFEEAIPVCQQLVKAVPGNPGLLLNLGMAEQMAGHPQQAIPRFEAVLKTYPDNVPALTSLGMAELQLNQPRKAISPLEKLLHIQPDDLNARGMLAGAYLSVNRAFEAGEQYRKLTSVDASDPKAWYGLGKAYEALAAKTFSALSRDDPQSPYVSALLADTRLQRRQFRSAFFFYHEAQRKLPDLPGLHTGLAKVYENTGHPDWASTERNLESSPAACSAQTAECQFLAGNWLAAARNSAIATSPKTLFWATRAYNQLATDAFNHLSQLPESVEIHELKAGILHGHGQDAEAATQWRAALALAPDDQRLETELASSLFLAHNYDELIPLLEKLLTREDNAPDLNFMLGASLWRTQQAEKALPYLTKASRTDPTMLPAQAAFGMVLALLNRNDEAIPHLEKALGLDDDGSLHYSLARAYQAAGKSDQAQKAMQQYAQIRAKNQQVNEELAKESEITAPRS